MAKKKGTVLLLLLSYFKCGLNEREGWEMKGLTLLVAFLLFQAPILELLQNSLSTLSLNRFSKDNNNNNKRR